MNNKNRKSLLAMTLGLALAFVAGGAFAAEPPTCDPKTQKCDPPPPPVCDPTKEKCDVKGFCHNIGGPRELGANCDGATGACQFTLDTGQTITVARNHFLGILIPPTSQRAIAAHIAHGDGPTVSVFDPALHLASTGQIHKASNVECLGARVLPQPPEPGN